MGLSNVSLFKERKQERYELRRKQKREQRLLRKGTRILGYDGTLCPRCGNRVELREHVSIGPTELARPYYYSHWYFCTNDLCHTNQIMFDKFKVYNQLEPVVDELRPGDDAIMDALRSLQPPPKKRGQPAPSSESN